MFSKGMKKIKKPQSASMASVLEMHKRTSSKAINGLIMLHSTRNEFPFRVTKTLVSLAVQMVLVSC